MAERHQGRARALPPIFDGAFLAALASQTGEDVATVKQALLNAEAAGYLVRVGNTYAAALPDASPAVGARLAQMRVSRRRP